MELSKDSVFTFTVWPILDFLRTFVYLFFWFCHRGTKSLLRLLIEVFTDFFSRDKLRPDLFTSKNYATKVNIPCSRAKVVVGTNFIEVSLRECNFLSTVSKLYHEKQHQLDGHTYPITSMDIYEITIIGWAKKNLGKKNQGKLGFFISTVRGILKITHGQIFRLLFKKGCWFKWAPPWEAIQKCGQLRSCKRTSRFSLLKPLVSRVHVDL